MRRKLGGTPNQLILELTANENMPLSKFLSDPCVMDALKRTKDPVMNYLFGVEGETNGKMEELIDYALFDYGDGSNNHKLSRVAGTILSAMSEGLQQRIYKSDFLHEKIDQYMVSEHIRNPLYAGHFSRIVLALTLFSEGEMLSRHPELMNFLVANIDIIGYMQLLNNLLDGFKDRLVSSDGTVSNIVAELIDTANTERKALATFSFLKNFAGDWSMICTEQVVSHLLEFALTNSGVVGDMAFHTTHKILSKCNAEDWVDPLLETYSKRMVFDGKNPTQRMITAFPIFVKYVWRDMLEFMFSRDNGSLHCAGQFFEILKKMPNEEISEIVDKYGFVQKIMENSDCFVINKDGDHAININGFVSRLALFLWDNPNLTSASLRDDPEWSIFACKYVLPLKVWMNEYSREMRKIKEQIDSNT